MKFNKKLHPSKKNAIKLKLCNFFLFLDQLHMKTGGKEGKSTSILFDDEIDTKPLKRKISKVPAATHALNYLNNFEQYFFKLWNCVFHILSEIYKVVLLQNRKKLHIQDYIPKSCLLMQFQVQRLVLNIFIKLTASVISKSTIPNFQ